MQRLAACAATGKPTLSLRQLALSTLLCTPRKRTPCFASYNDLILTGKLWTYLADLNEQAQNRLHCIIAQMKETEEITEELKAQDQMAWVRAMNSIRNRAEEIVRHELIYDAKEVL